MTGGNDDCIAIWNIGDYIKDAGKRPTASNGMSVYLLNAFVND